LPRHGKGHRLLPSEINHRANIHALRSLGVRFVICVTAVGSLKEKYHPRDILLPDQFFDRTSRREHHTFFGRGIVGHVAFAEPISAPLRKLLAGEARAAGATVHDGGTYVCMDGPAFSTRAESNANRQLGFDVIGMTNLPEAKLAREAEMALATLAMVTDYDCWKTDEAHVTVDAIIGHLHANAGMAKDIIARVIPRLPQTAEWPEHHALDNAIITDRRLWPPATVDSLRVFLQRFL
jgi:5'-methylthioadenosine phosphorylase